MFSPFIAMASTAGFSLSIVRTFPLIITRSAFSDLLHEDIVNMVIIDNKAIEILITGLFNRGNILKYIEILLTRRDIESIPLEIAGLNHSCNDNFTPIRVIICFFMTATTSKQVISQKKSLHMNIVLIGYGRMGHEIESIAIKRGHLVKLIVDIENISDLNEMNMRGIDVAIEFSSPGAAFNNITKCLTMKVPVVSGTTGWLENYDRATDICRKNNTSFIHSSNFSLGVNLLFRLNSELARLMDRFHAYRVSIEEIHHVKKLDAPSGTAISLSGGIIEEHSEYDRWCYSDENSINCIPIRSIREGVVTGTHTVTWDSEIDTISLRHEAKNRKGLALGAVIAAEYISSKEGIFTMNDVMGF
jgi:4-hydroxy-tetrahydrodipicolinate reductase